MTPEHLMRILMAESRARYKLDPVPGKPEELKRRQPTAVPPKQQTDDLGVSFGYAGGEVVVRPMQGRRWIDPPGEEREVRVRSYSIGTNVSVLLPRLHEQLDPHFGAPAPTPAAVRRRPIIDNPQA